MHPGVVPFSLILTEGSLRLLDLWVNIPGQILSLGSLLLQTFFWSSIFLFFCWNSNYTHFVILAIVTHTSKYLFWTKYFFQSIFLLSLDLKTLSSSSLILLTSQICCWTEKFSFSLLPFSVLEFSFSSVQFSHSVVSDSLRPHKLQHARPPCPSPTPRVHSNSRPSSRWCIQPSHPGSSPFPPAPNPSQQQSLFQWVNSWHEVAKVLEFQL